MFVDREASGSPQARPNTEMLGVRPPHLNYDVGIMAKDQMARGIQEWLTTGAQRVVLSVHTN